MGKPSFRPWQRAPWALPLGLVLGCHTPPPASEQRVPEVRLYGVQMTSFRGEVRVASGTAERVSYARGPAEVTAQQADLHIEQTTRATAMTPSVPTGATSALQAPVVVGNLLTHGFDASGGVRVSSSTGLKGSTERAHYDAAHQHVTGHEPVRVSGPGYALQAIGMSLDLRDEEYSFEGPLRSRIGKGT